ncbi:MAG: response regulator [Acetivibrionales bacterium]|jgi:two-component system chemotaxis response regulator CheY
MKRVLIVDDACFMRMTITMMLKNHDFEIVGEAGTGIDGVKKYKELRPDIVTLDITMPEMSGLEALKLIREFDPQANVIMISALGQDLLVREAILNGAKSFIVKPFNEAQVVQVFNKILGA